MVTCAIIICLCCCPRHVFSGFAMGPWKESPQSQAQEGAQDILSACGACVADEGFGQPMWPQTCKVQQKSAVSAVPAIPVWQFQKSTGRWSREACWPCGWVRSSSLCTTCQNYCWETMCALQVSRQILLILFRNRHSYQCNRGMLKTIEQDANCMLVTWLGNFSCNSCSHCIIVNIVLAIWCFAMSKGREIERERGRWSQVTEMWRDCSSTHRLSY